MKKILSLMILIIGLTSCLAKVDLEKDTGSLSINIGANTSQKSNISRAISSDTTKIYINLFQPSTHTEITREIAYTQGQSYNLTIDNLTEGVWDLHISTYNEISASIQTGTYFDMIEIYKDKDTFVSHKFGSPKKVFYPANGFLGSEWSGQDMPFVGDKVMMSGMNGFIGFRNEGSTYNVGGSYNPNPSYDHVTIQFVMSKDPEMKRDFVRYFDGYDYLNYYPTTATLSADGSGVNYGKVYLTVASSVSDNTFNSLEINTTYYWKAIVTNSIGTTESKVFSFTTPLP